MCNRKQSPAPALELCCPSGWYMGLQTTSSAPVQMLELFPLPERSGHCVEKKGLKLTEILHSGVFLPYPTQELHIGGWGQISGLWDPPRHHSFLSVFLLIFILSALNSQSAESEELRHLRLWCHTVGFSRQARTTCSGLLDTFPLDPWSYFSWRLIENPII